MVWECSESTDVSSRGGVDHHRSTIARMEYTKQALRFLGKYLNNATEGQERQLKNRSPNTDHFRNGIQIVNSATLRRALAALA